MPANPKYLTTSKSQRFAKLSAALLGSFLVTAAIHLVFAAYISPKVTLKTAQYSLFIIWVGLMFVPYLMRDGWKCWLLFIGLILFFAALIWLRLPIN